MSKTCTCLLCQPVTGKQPHPKYGYDIKRVPAMECKYCHEIIGAEPYFEQLSLARFGSMGFIHQRCDTPAEMRLRTRMEQNWDRRSRREERLETGSVDIAERSDKMKLDKDKFYQNEEKSNHAVVAMAYSECPIKSYVNGCFYVATGFGGGITGKCEHLTDEGECLFEEPDH